MSDQDFSPDGPGSSLPPPPPPPPPGPAAPPPGSRGSILLGLGIGVASMLTTAGLAWALSGGVSVPQFVTEWVGAFTGVLPFAMIVLGIVLSAMPNTRRTGAGILLSFGVLILVAGGLCVALIAGFNTVP